MLAEKTTPEGKGFRTFYQAVAGVAVAFFAGLWDVPGVPEFAVNFAKSEGLSLLFFLAIAVGVPAGLVSFFQNKVGK